MTKLAQLPRFERRAAAEPAEGRALRLRTRYYAFLSYSHKDKELADWLHRELEKFRVPGALAGKLTANGVVPRRLTPIFRDQHDLSAGDDLAVEIEAALAASQFLLVLCSPTAAKSLWTNLEIESFKRTRPEGCVLAAVVAGEPFASDIPGREDEECFPPALRYKYDRRGHRTQKRAEPLAADFRAVGEGRRLAFLKLVAGMLGVGLDELVQRDQTRRHRQLAFLAAGSLAGMAVTSTLAVTSIQARDSAREQRRQAEGLVQFMLGDLKDKLEPIGRLDALDGVGSRVLAYYSKQDMSELSDAALTQRSKALSLMGEVANLRGDTDGALRLYREAMVGTGEAVERKPDDPERLFEHAQNVFYVGEINLLQGDNRAAEAAFREYKRLATGMITLAPENMKYRMELQYANFNLGTVLYKERLFTQAEAPFDQALRTIQALASADPDNTDYQQNLPEAFAWLADAKMSQGKIAQAATVREQQAALLTQLLSKTHDDAYYRLRLAKANQALGELYAMEGRLDAAAQRARAAIDDANLLLSVEPDNTRSIEFAMKAHLTLANILLDAGDKGGSAAETNSACTSVSTLLSHHKPSPAWQAGLRDCWMLRARLAFSSGAKQQALSAAENALRAARSVSTADRGDDAVSLAKAYRLVGDGNRALGDNASALAAWNSAYAALPKGVTERPTEMREHAVILARLGRTAEAEVIARRLAQIGLPRSELSRIG
jgi:tetratricopeptide (TPR) repeat protein